MVLLYIAYMDPINKNPVMLAFFYQHQPDPSWDMKFSSLRILRFPERCFATDSPISRPGSLTENRIRTF